MKSLLRVGISPDPLIEGRPYDEIVVQHSSENYGPWARFFQARLGVQTHDAYTRKPEQALCAASAGIAL